MDQGQTDAREWIRSGAAILGIEFGSTRIKASLIGPDMTPLAAGSHLWENRFEDGVWTYDMADVHDGLAACVDSLVEDVRARYSVDVEAVAAMGVSGMMHGYIALDAQGELLVPFRTWRNNITSRACAELSPRLDFAVPQRWSIAHLYQSILERQPHVGRIAHLTTLAGYIHWRLTGKHVVGVGEASGMFPIDPGTGDWDAERVAAFDTSSRRGTWAGSSATSFPRAARPARPAGRLRPRAPGCSTRSGALRPASPCAHLRAMPARAWSPRMRSGRDQGTCPPAPRCSR